MLDLLNVKESLLYIYITVCPQRPPGCVTGLRVGDHRRPGLHWNFMCPARKGQFLSETAAFPPDRARGLWCALRGLRALSVCPRARKRRETVRFTACAAFGSGGWSSCREHLRSGLEEEGGCVCACKYGVVGAEGTGQVPGGAAVRHLGSRHRLRSGASLTLPLLWANIEREPPRGKGLVKTRDSWFIYRKQKIMGWCGSWLFFSQEKYLL